MMILYNWMLVCRSDSRKSQAQISKAMSNARKVCKLRLLYFLFFCFLEGDDEDDDEEEDGDDVDDEEVRFFFVALLSTLLLSPPMPATADFQVCNTISERLAFPAVFRTALQVRSFGSRSLP